MFGFSIFLNQPLHPDTYTYLVHMKQAGFSGVFTSIHIPEDDPEVYLSRLTELGKICQKLKLTLMVDVSANALEKIGLSFQQPEKLSQLGITGIRMDYGIDNHTIATLSHHLTIGLNASTFTYQDMEELTAYHADISQMEMWHNYYPRESTGLDRTTFTQKNQWLNQLGFQTMAFVPGDTHLRAPLYTGLPTLEEHRAQSSFFCALDLLTHCCVDDIFIGDPGLCPITQEQFSAYIHQHIIVLAAEKIDPLYQTYLLETLHQNRQDSARDVIRSATSRLDLQETIILPTLAVPRPTGAITLDNQLYGRYMGELQITKRDLPIDNRVNVIGHICVNHLNLLPFILGGQTFKLIEKSELI